jgi:hypothetical protein
VGRLPRICALITTMSLATLSAFMYAQTLTQVKDDVREQLNKSRITPFPLSEVATCDKQGLLYHNSGDLDITARGSVLLIQGRDLTNQAWAAKLSVTGLGCMIFQADLDENGHPELLIYTPGIGVGEISGYDSRLTILLFDKQGKPFPWQATGRFRVLSGGIQEVVPDSNGAAILQTSEFGLGAWDGISYVSFLYRLDEGKISATSQSYAGIRFPHIVKGNPADKRLERTAREIDLSMNVIAQNMSSPVQDTDALFVRYAPYSTSSPTQQSSSEANSSGFQPTNVTVTETVSEGEHIVLSDGTKLNLPDVLVIDRLDQGRQIVFRPEAEDFERLGDRSYRVHQTGFDCSGIDDCQPFILWAK